jgi:hypothetical protein
MCASLSAYTPPACSGSPLYLDVPNADAFCPWIRELWREGFDFGCGNSNYCPNNPATRAQLALFFGRALHEHVWGEGRPGALIHGVPFGGFEQLCTSPVPGVFFGLSALSTNWSGAGAACPAGYWVCTDGERGSGACNTTRADDASDTIYCDGSCVDLASDHHFGWVADGGFNRFGFMRDEAGTAQPVFACYTAPVWCCTRG